MSTHELILTVLREKLNPDTHSALLALSDEEFRKVLFLNFRTQHGQARGMKLTHIGYALMSECFKSFVIEIEESKKARITNIHWVVLDRECNLPYYYNDNKIVLFEEELALLLKLYGGDISMIKNINNTVDS